MKRLERLDELPTEVRQLSAFKPWWYLLVGALIITTAPAVVLLAGQREGEAWVLWATNVIMAVQATLSLFLVILTYNLFAVASRTTSQNERIHRISQLPLVVADVEPLSFDPHPGYRVRIMNEGSGPALDVRVSFDYQLTEELARNRRAEHASDVRLRIGVLNKSSHTGVIQIDARGIMMRKPWRQLDVVRNGPPNDAETQKLLQPYSLVVHITYKDIYSQNGHTAYEASYASGGGSIELVELVAPSVEIGAEVKPIVFLRDEAASPLMSPASPG